MKRLTEKQLLSLWKKHGRLTLRVFDKGDSLLDRYRYLNNDVTRQRRGDEQRYVLCTAGRTRSQALCIYRHNTRSYWYCSCFCYNSLPLSVEQVVYQMFNYDARMGLRIHSVSTGRTIVWSRT